MPYLGNTPTTQSFISGTDYFNGTGAQTAFTLSRTVASQNDVEAVVNNVVQQPNAGYTISGTTITFTSAPSAGTQNVYVRYLSTTTQAISPSQGTVGWNQLNTDTQQDLGISFKNRIINGNMRIDQRNAGASVTANDGVFPVDRFRFFVSQSSKGTSQQSTTAPAGYINSLLFTSSSAYSVAASDYFNIAQVIEGLNVSDLAWGTANAATVTLSFWVRSSLTGTFGGAVNNSANSRSYPFSYTISAANTFEYKTVTIPGDTSGTWLTTNGIGIRVFFSLGAGSTYLGSSSAWGATDYRGGLTGATSVVGTNGATWYITGVQFEVGTQATTFTTAGGSYGAELALCQRYYYKEFPAATGYVLSQGSGAVSTTAIKATGKFPVTLRTKPSALEQSGTANQYQVVVAGTATTCSAVPTHDGATNEENWICNATVASGLTTGQAGYLRTDSTNGATAYLAWSAEL